eukprot:m.58210 g.58210  ORF g.58210 m.58210 type:complete len:71 (+) comp13133_c0_seq1:2049-2261(+)
MMTPLSSVTLLRFGLAMESTASSNDTSRCRDRYRFMTSKTKRPVFFTTAGDVLWVNLDDRELLQQQRPQT